MPKKLKSRNDEELLPAVCLINEFPDLSALDRIHRLSSLEEVMDNDAVHINFVINSLYDSARSAYSVDDVIRLAKAFENILITRRRLMLLPMQKASDAQDNKYYEALDVEQEVGAGWGKPNLKLMPNN